MPVTAYALSHRTCSVEVNKISFTKLFSIHVLSHIYMEEQVFLNKFIKNNLDNKS